MSSKVTAAFIYLVLSTSVGCQEPEARRAGADAPDDQIQDAGIDVRSYRLGGIGAFAEMVGAGVKKLALSAPMDPDEMEALIQDAGRIAGDHGVGAFLESEFLVTDLFPDELTEGKQVLLICQDATYQEYLALKAFKVDLEEAGEYVGDARAEVARRFGRMLSYSEEKIDALLEGRDSTR